MQGSFSKTPYYRLHLPNELLLDIFLHVARMHPRSLPKLYYIGRHWLEIIKRYECLLWQTATLSAFPGSSFPDRHDDMPITGGSLHHIIYWKQKFRIHLGWSTKEAQVLVVTPHRPKPSSVPETQPPSSISISAEHHMHSQSIHDHHMHDHHQLHLLGHYAHDNIEDDREIGNSFLVHEPLMVAHSSSQCQYTALNDSSELASPDNVKSQFSSEPSFLQQGEILSCSLCTYADLCLIPQLQICVRTHRNRDQPLMQVLDWSLQHVVDLNDTVNSHQDLISGTAVNEDGTLFVSCSIDGTVRVWDVNQEFSIAHGRGRIHGDGVGRSFLDKVVKYGCPIQSRWLLTGHIGWVNAVAIEKTTVVSGGSDHAVRLWDALSGSLIHVIPDLYTSRPELGLGVYAVTIHDSVIGSGSVIEGYQLHDANTGELIFELDEPLSSRDHFRFETELYQQYASRIAITDTVVVTNSKIEGMLCVWNRETGDLMYKIQAFTSSGQDTVVNPTDYEVRKSKEQSSRGTAVQEVEHHPLVTYHATDSHSRLRGSIAPHGVAGNVMRAFQEENTVHTFKVNKSGSMLMCTLCDGRVSLIEFGAKCSKGYVSQRSCQSWTIEPSGHGSLMPHGSEVELQDLQHNEQAHHHCGALAWIWAVDSQGGNRVVLV
ncbi:hypothetical protein BGX28_002882 [Mortierella sp. GBA30]|nr:hypothetical protein BGX28_002882 [Mortierella sp. GBA30]